METGSLVPYWKRAFVPLLDGVHQVVIRGTRSGHGVSGLAVDDLTIMDCNKFSKFVII